MKLFTNALIILASLIALASSTEEEGTYLYDRTKICAKHKSYLCLSYSKKQGMVVLSGKNKLNFEIETVERVNMKLNRVYTYAVDKATRKKVKSCLVRKALDESTFGIDLAPCDTDDRELVLAVEVPEMDFSKISTDEFVLKEISYLDSGNTISSPYCLSASTKSDESLTKATTKKQLKVRTPVILAECGTDEEVYGQEFKAKNFRRATSSRLIAKQDVEVAAEIGLFCLSDEPELCLGVSLTNGTSLEAEKLVQVKNLTKNEAKGKTDLKMRWYRDLQNNRIASASNMDFCLEAVYGASIGDNRAGREQFDDVVHLGSCESAVVQAGRMEGLPKSENFYIQEVVTPTSSYIEIRTDVPVEASDSVSTEPKCVSIVKCVTHSHGHCTPYNSVAVYDDIKLVAQGSHARLKDCNSEEMLSQRFFYVADHEVTVPPTKYPTQKPTEPPVEGETTNAPTPEPTPEPTAKPTPKPTFFVEPALPPSPDNEEGSTVEERTVTTRDTSGLLIALAMVGFFCLLIILVALAYYYKNRGVVTGLPEEDENFIARV